MRYLLIFELSNPLSVNSIFNNLSQNQSHQLGKSPVTTTDKTLSSGDYRLGCIVVESIDMSYQKGIYVASSTSTELGMGIIHLWKGPERVDEKDVKLTLSHQTPVPYARAGEPIVQDVIAVLAVPSYMTSADFVGFIGDTVQRKVSHLRMIRTNEPNRYMVLMKFRHAQDAKWFRSEYNGKSFNSMDPETAHVVAISSVSFKNSLSSASAFPYLLDASQDAISSTSTKPLAPPTASLNELPTCVVCLERMDATETGLLTILCQHTFHCSCLSKWGDSQSTCPICRYSQSRDNLESTDSSACSHCMTEKNLWMCLICGNVGCGRYDGMHAVKHYEKIKHNYAMDLSTGRVWNYAGDGYVHKLLQDKAEKFVDAKSSATTEKERKTDDGSAEFEGLLTTQLESQRMYYEDQVKAAVDKAGRTAKSLNQATSEMALLKADMDTMKTIVSELRSEIQGQRAAVVRGEAKAKTFSDMARRMEKEYKEEKSMNASLMMKLTHLEEQRLDVQLERSTHIAQVEELQDQVRDLMLHFASVEKVKEMDDVDVQAGTIALPGIVEAKTKPKKAKRKPNKSTRE